jgi:hypothetical protein
MMSWRDIVKLKGKQKNLDKNHNGVIDAQDFYIMNGETKKGFEITNLSPPRKKKKEVCPHCGQKISKPTKTSLIDRAKQANKENPRMGSGR